MALYFILVDGQKLMARFFHHFREFGSQIVALFLPIRLEKHRGFDRDCKGVSPNIFGKASWFVTQIGSVLKSNRSKRVGTSRKIQ